MYFFLKVLTAQKLGGVGVVMLEADDSVKDMHCVADECALPIHIPATSVPLSAFLTS